MAQEPSSECGFMAPLAHVFSHVERVLLLDTRSSSSKASEVVPKGQDLYFCVSISSLIDETYLNTKRELHDQATLTIQACINTLTGLDDIGNCFAFVTDRVGSGWAVVIFSCAWLAFLVALQSIVVRLGCGRLRAAERVVARQAVYAHLLRSIVFVFLYISPKNEQEWGFWVVWFSCTGLLVLFEAIAKVHFEHVVDNPNFGVFHTVRTMTLLAIALCGCMKLGVLSWAEFVDWGKGPVGQVVMSRAFTEDGQHGGADSKLPSAASRDGSGQGGVGFALLFIYDLGVIGTDIGLALLKYIANLLEMHKDPAAAYAEEDSVEQLSFYVHLGQAIVGVGRNSYLFRICGKWPYIRMLATRILTSSNITRALERTTRAASKVMRAKEMDGMFSDATDKELKAMAADESCAICLKSMASAKRLTCQHYFHSGCLRRYLNSAKGDEFLCPICRSPISPNQPACRGEKPRGGPSNGDGAARPQNVPPHLHGMRWVHQQAPSFRGHVPTPDSLSRAARGAHNAVRFGRRLTQWWLGDGMNGEHLGRFVGTAEARHAGPGDFGGVLRGDVSALRDNTPRASGDGFSRTEGFGSRETSPAMGAVARQLLELFPDISREVALTAAQLARGSVERAVDVVLASGSGLTSPVPIEQPDMVGRRHVRGSAAPSASSSRTMPRRRWR